MKLHNMILIGMAIGVVVGYLLGPDSPILHGDVVLLQGRRAPAVFDEADGQRLEAPTEDIRALVAAREGESAGSPVQGRLVRFVNESGPMDRFFKPQILDVSTVVRKTV